MLLCFKNKNIKPILNITKPEKPNRKFERLWFIATNLREPINLYEYLRTAKEMENLTWNHTNQIDYHLKLIQNRVYLRTDFSQSFNGLSDTQKELLCNTDIDITYEQAKEIAKAKCYNDIALRGRSDIAPLIKLGLVLPLKYSKRKIIITDVGNKFLNHEISLEEMLVEQFLKMQYPCAIDTHNIKWNTKPFINTLRLIKQVNEICLQKGMKVKGITKTEVGIFVTSLSCPSDIKTVANKLVDFRIEYSKLKTQNQKLEFKQNYIKNYLIKFLNPLDKIDKIKKVDDYADSIIRYMRATKYIYIRGKYGNACIDLEPRRMVEINSILEYDNGTCDIRENRKWIQYFTTYGTYNLPFNTVEKQQEILQAILNEINTLEEKLHKNQTEVPLISDIKELKTKIAELRDYRTKLQNLEIHYDSEHDVTKIDEVITNLYRLCKPKKSEDVDGLKPSIALEKWVNVALNIIGDSILIKPNSIVGDDNEPISTAPAGVPDIECYYNDFNVVCEVTLITDRSQWYNESQPVFRHINKFIETNSDKTCYGLVIAPSWHEDTINEYHIHVKYGYKDTEMKIVPLTITQLIEILQTVKYSKESKNNITQRHLKTLYDKIIKSAMDNNSEEWIKNKIPEILSNWKHSMLIKEENPVEKLWNKLGLYKYRPFQDVEYYIDFNTEKQYTIIEYLSKFYSIQTYPVDFADGTHHAIGIDMPERVEAIQRRFDVALADLLYMIYDGLKPQEQAVINGILKKPTLKDDISK